MKAIVYTFLFILISLLILSCASSRELNQDYSEYRIEKIISKNSWYIVYATKQDTLYKIVTAANETNEDCSKIAVGKRYELDLKSRRENAPEVNGTKLQPVNYLDIQCFSYDTETEICIEPKKGIYDLHFTDDLNGLCYQK